MLVESGLSEGFSFLWVAITFRDRLTLSMYSASSHLDHIGMFAQAFGVTFHSFETWPILPVSVPG